VRLTLTTSETHFNNDLKKLPIAAKLLLEDGEYLKDYLITQAIVIKNNNQTILESYSRPMRNQLNSIPDAKGEINRTIDALEYYDKSYDPPLTKGQYEIALTFEILQFNGDRFLPLTISESITINIT
jgi:hypothetical protein